MGVSVQRHVPATSLPGKRFGTHCTGAWVGPEAGLEGSENSRPRPIRSRTVQPAANRYTD